MAEKVCAVSAHSLHGEVRWHNVAVMLATRIGCAVARLERRTKSFVMWRFSECEFAVRLVGSAICRAFAFLVILSAFSAGAKSFGSQDNKELGRIEGKISATSGEPIAGALVALVDKDGEKKTAADTHRILGDVKEKNGDPVGAVNEYEKAAQADPSEENYFAWGAELLLHRAAGAAIEVFSKGAKEHANSAAMQAGLGAAFYANGQFEAAARR